MWITLILQVHLPNATVVSSLMGMMMLSGVSNSEALLHDLTDDHCPWESPGGQGLVGFGSTDTLERWRHQMPGGPGPDFSPTLYAGHGETAFQFLPDWQHH